LLARLPGYRRAAKKRNVPTFEEALKQDGPHALRGGRLRECWDLRSLVLSVRWAFLTWPGGTFATGVTWTVALTETFPYASIAKTLYE